MRMAALGLMACACPALAQQTSPFSVGDNFVTPSLPLDYDRGQNTSVLDRPRPEYESTGMHLGGFTLHPRLEISAGYTDNAYQAASGQADGYVVIAPTARLASNWSRHALGLDAGAGLWRYTTQARRDQTDWHVGLTGHYDISGAASLEASARTEHAAEPPTSAAYPTAAQQASQYQVTTVHVAPGWEMGRVKLLAAYDFITYAFDPYRSFSGTMVDQSNRDATTHSGTARGEYAITPDMSVFVQGDYDVLGYAHALLPGVPNRDSTTLRGLAGVSFDLAAKLRGSVALGYMRRRYDDAALYAAISGLTAEMRVEYFPDALTTLTLTGRRIIEDSPYVNASGFVNSSLALRVDHELLRNLLLNAQVAIEQDSFTGVNQTVDILRVSGGARWLLSRAVGLGVTVSHDARAAHGALALPTYAETRVLVSAVVQH